MFHPTTNNLSNHINKCLRQTVDMNFDIHCIEIEYEIKESINRGRGIFTK